MAEHAVEVSFDSIVGPTHNYAGLSYGNLASMRNRRSESNPRAAALEGLAKMKFLHDLGLRQAVLPPHERPHLPTLRRLGFAGSDAQVLQQARAASPVLLAACSSASAMWAANAATISPSADAPDGRVHFTPANLITQFHRSIETATTARILRAIFPDERHFVHHPPLPAAEHFADEGAANHTRLCRDYGEMGFELFAFGRHAFDPDDRPHARFPARQTMEASAAIARMHGVGEGRRGFLQQDPEAIEAGAFHNDVVAVGNRDVLLYHQRAYRDPQELESVAEDAARACGLTLHLIEVPESAVTLSEAVASYLFNSQLVTLPGGTMSLVAPAECLESKRVRCFIEELLSQRTPIRSAHYVDVRQSMRNGGGPACLRLRVVLSDAELAAAHQGVFLTEALYARLVEWVQKHYPDKLTPDDLADPALLQLSRDALDALTGILGLGNIYEFQSEG